MEGVHSETKLYNVWCYLGLENARAFLFYLLFPLRKYKLFLFPIILCNFVWPWNSEYRRYNGNNSMQECDSPGYHSRRGCWTFEGYRQVCIRTTTNMFDIILCLHTLKLLSIQPEFKLSVVLSMLKTCPIT